MRGKPTRFLRWADPAFNPQAVGLEMLWRSEGGNYEWIPISVSWQTDVIAGEMDADGKNLAELAMSGGA